MKTQFLAKFNFATAALDRVIGAPRATDSLTEERDAYAEIGRIVGLPFSSAKVYERFAEQVARLIPFDLIVITNLNPEHDTYSIMYTLGNDLVGLGQGDTVPLTGSVVADVAISPRPMRTDNRVDSNKAAQSLDNAGLLSRIATPLIANEQAVGTLHLASSLPDAYGDLELTRLEIVGNQIAGAIASTLLLQAERNRTSQLESLYDIAAIISQPLSFQAKAQKIVDKLHSISEADQVVLRRIEDNEDELVLVASAGLGKIDFPDSLKVVNANRLTFNAFHDGKPLLINDYSTYAHAQPGLMTQGVVSLFFMPINPGSQTLGSLTIVSKNANHFDDGKIALITAFSNEIGYLFNSADQAAKLEEAREVALEKERQNAREQNGLYQISRIFAGVGDFKSKATAALEIFVSLANADWTTLRLAKDSEPGLHLAAAAGPAVAEFSPKPVITEDRVKFLEAYQTGKVIVTGEYESPNDTRMLTDLEMQSMMFLPIKVEERTLGLVVVVSKKKNAFDAELVELLTSVVEGFGNLLEISILQEESEIARKELELLTEKQSRSNEQIMKVNKLLEDTMITRTEELETARNQAKQSEKLATIGHLAAGMAHDLRNPLGAIRNASYLLKRELASIGAADTSPKLNRCLEIIEKQVLRSNKTITDLMAFARLEKTKLVETRLEDVMQYFLETLTIRSGITLVQEIDSSVQPFMADSEQLQRVFVNLANNAQEAMPDGGCLTIAAKITDDFLEVTFSDEGEGISDEDLGKIFDPLFTTKMQGTGLGLAVCQGIIERHGGTINAHRNEPASRGTTFKIRIPEYYLPEGEPKHDQ